jgi:hypothetical protein
MRVNVNGTWYDADNENILVVELTSKDRENIANMTESATLYCSYNNLVNSNNKISSYLDTLKAESK